MDEGSYGNAETGEVRLRSSLLTYYLLDSPEQWQCAKCGEWKPTNGFYRDKSHANGLTSRCKKCLYTRKRSVIGGQCVRCSMFKEQCDPHVRELERDGLCGYCAGEHLLEKEVRNG